MSRAAKTPALPAGLPPLPEVPEGWDRWEYKGVGWRCYEPTVHARFRLPCHDWVVHRTPTQASGGPSHHYIVAVRDPKPAPKKGKGRVEPIVAKQRLLGNNIPPTFVLPADADSVERMVAQIDAAIVGMEWRSTNDALARAALAAIGIRAPKKGGAE